MGHWMQVIMKDESMTDEEYQEMLDDAHEQIDEEESQDEPEKVECFECDRTFIAYRDESICPECLEIISINRAHA